MAIKLPDPGNGIPEQKTGNDEWTNMKIVRDNFADQSNAASRLVGARAVDVMDRASLPISDISGVDNDSNNNNGFYAWRNATNLPSVPSDILTPSQTSFGVIVKARRDQSVFNLVAHRKDLSVLWYESNSLHSSYKIYTSANTTRDTATGFLKASSPVLHVYNDSITKIHEAEQLDITVDKKGTGHYEIHGTTGLRKNDGWFMSPPRDVHGNVLCMVDLDEKDGVVILKTYKKKFDFETVSIVHDFDNPMDIPDGVCVEFRFNDLPEELLDEPAI